MFRGLKEYPRIMWIIAVGTTISATGEAFFWPLTTAYIHNALGRSLTVAMTVLLLQYSFCLIGNVVGGMLFDRWSGRKTITLAVCSAICILVLMALQHDFYTFVGLLMLLGLCNGMIWPLMRALGATLWPEGGRRAMNMLYVAHNLGVALGSTLGGLLASQSFTLAFLGNALSYLIFIGIFLFNVREQHLAPATRKDKKGGEKSAAPRIPFTTWTSLGMLCMGLTVLVVTYTQWQTTYSAYIMDLGSSMTAYSFLWTLNGIVIVAGQPLLSFVIHRFSLTLKQQIVYGAMIFALSTLCIMVTESYAGFVAGMVIITLGEMLVWPGVPALAADMAPPGRTGLFQGIAFSGQSVGRMFGPLLGGLLYEQASAQTMLLTMTALSVLSVVSFAYYNRVGRRAASTVSGTVGQ
jgi:MFS family permease